MSNEQSIERSLTMNLNEEPRTSVADDTPDGELFKRRKKSNIEVTQLSEVREERSVDGSDTSDIGETVKRKKQQVVAVGSEGCKPGVSGMSSPRTVRPQRRSWESLKVKAKRAHTSYNRQRLKSVGGSPDKPDLDLSQVLGVGLVANGSDLQPGEGGVLGRALSAPTGDAGFSLMLNYNLSDQDMLDNNNDGFGNEMSDCVVASDHKMSDREGSDRQASDQEMFNERSDQEMSIHVKLDNEYLSHVQLDQDFSHPDNSGLPNHEQSDFESSDHEKSSHAEMPRKMSLTSRLLQLKLKHYESIVNHEREQHALEMQVKRAQLLAAQSQKAAYEEMRKTAVSVRDTVNLACIKFEHTTDSLRRVAESCQRRNSNHFCDGDISD